MTTDQVNLVGFDGYSRDFSCVVPGCCVACLEFPSNFGQGNSAGN